MLAAAVEQAHGLDPATHRLGGGQQFDAGPTLSVLSDALNLIEMDQGDHAALVADVAHESGRVGKDQQPLRH